MKVTAFRIKNYRSIKDTDWCPLSSDGVTVLVGQNESGKTSILDALSITFSNNGMTEDDRRADAPLPLISLKIECPFSELEEGLAKFQPGQVRALKKYWGEINGAVQMDFSFAEELKDGKVIYDRDFDVIDDRIPEVLLQAEEEKPVSAPAIVTQPDGAPVEGPKLLESKPEFEVMDIDDLSRAVFHAAPLFVVFNASTGTLPNEIDIDDKYEPLGRGAVAAKNFLSVAGIDLKELLSKDRRTRESILTRANAAITAEFNSFWSQTIGKDAKLSLKCELENYGVGLGDKSGKSHLVFWTNDGHTQLYPKQRSEGVRWFVSFFLQMKAAERQKNVGGRVFLMDEPGANLHPKAQGDVLKLINNLRTSIPVVYSTHSPHLIEYDHLYRVHAVQRDGTTVDSPTIVIDAHRLGAASTDTLSPVLTAMGVDLSSQQVIRKKNNVLLEEVSGFYYLSAFWALTDCKQEAFFLAATGVNKLEILANLFLGWGLEFIVVVDDDTQGRGVYKNLRRDICGDVDELSAQKLMKLKDLDGIEDVFSARDFKEVILKENVEIAGKNTEYLKRANRSKPVMAFHFKLAVERGEVTMETLDADTQAKIRGIVSQIEALLAKQ